MSNILRKNTTPINANPKKNSLVDINNKGSKKRKSTKEEKEKYKSFSTCCQFRLIHFIFYL